MSYEMFGIPPLHYPSKYDHPICCGFPTFDLGEASLISLSARHLPVFLPCFWAGLSVYCSDLIQTVQSVLDNSDLWDPIVWILGHLKLYHLRVIPLQLQM